MDLHAIVDFLRETPPILVFLLLFLAAFVEYVLPPAPGDTLVVAGAVLVAAFGWSFVAVLGATTAGAVAGAWVDLHIGRWLVRTGRLERLGAGASATIDGIVTQMRRHGALYLVVNRFLPGIRAFFFVAAGLAGLRTPPVLLWSGLSALAWNALLVGVGFLLGANLDAVEDLLARYTLVMVLLVGGVTAFFIGRVIWRGKQAKKKLAVTMDKSQEK